MDLPKIQTGECLNDLCTCGELEWSPIPDPACPIHKDDLDLITIEQNRRHLEN